MNFGINRYSKKGKNMLNKEAVENFIKNDRQWTRPMRIAHAKYQLSIAKNADDKEFWTEILNRNEGE